MRQTFVISIVLVLGLVSAPALAQVDEELAGDSRGGSDSGYAWGEGAGASEADDPLRIMAFLGAGFGVRLLRNLDFNQDFMTPAYLDLGGAVFFPGGAIRHGVGLGLTATMLGDAGEVKPFQQWGITPSYHFLVPLNRVIDDMDHDWVHIQGRFGIPLVLSGTSSGGVDLSIGGELAAAVHFKFLAGLGLYLEVTGALYGGSKDTLHPVIGFDAGFIFDYEVLQ